MSHQRGSWPDLQSCDRAGHCGGGRRYRRHRDRWSRRFCRSRFEPHQLRGGSCDRGTLPSPIPGLRARAPARGRVHSSPCGPTRRVQRGRLPHGSNDWAHPPGLQVGIGSSNTGLPSPSTASDVDRAIQSLRAALRELTDDHLPELMALTPIHEISNKVEGIEPGMRALLDALPSSPRWAYPGPPARH